MHLGLWNILEVKLYLTAFNMSFSYVRQKELKLITEGYLSYAIAIIWWIYEIMFLTQWDSFSENVYPLELLYSLSIPLGQ